MFSRTIRHRSRYERTKAGRLQILFREETPEELYEKKLTVQQLNRALAKLPVKQSQHIYAHFFLGKSCREIAMAEQVSIRAVQKSLRGGLKRLAAILKKV